MKINVVVVMVLLSLGAASVAADDFLYPLSISSRNMQDVAQDSVRNADTLAIAETERQAFKPATGSDPAIHSSAPEKNKKPWPTGALLRSAIIPGWGQVYNRHYLKAVIYGGTEIALAYTTAQYWKQMDSHQKNFMNSTDRTYQAQEYFYYQNSRDNRNLFLWLTGLTFFVSIFDAYVDAHFADFDEKDKAFEAYLAPKNDGLYLSLNFTLK